MFAEQENSRCEYDCADSDLTSLPGSTPAEPPRKHVRSRGEIARWVAAVASETSAQRETRPRRRPIPSTPVSPIRSRSMATTKTRQYAKRTINRKKPQAVPASPSSSAASPTPSYISFPPYPEDDSDSCTSAEEDCLTRDSQSLDSVSSASVCSPARKVVAAGSLHSRHSSETGSCLSSWSSLGLSPYARSASSNSSIFPSTRYSLDSVYARAEPSTLVSRALCPQAFSFDTVLVVPHSSYFYEDEYDWPRRRLTREARRLELQRWEMMAARRRRRAQRRTAAKSA